MDNKNIVILALVAVVLVLFGVIAGMSLNSNNNDNNTTNDTVNITLNETNNTTDNTTSEKVSTSSSKSSSSSTSKKSSSSKPLVEGVDYDSSGRSYSEYERTVKNNPGGHYDLERNYYGPGEGNDNYLSQCC